MCLLLPWCHLLSIYINILFWQRLKVFIYIKPFIILCWPRRSGLNLGFLRQVKLFACIFACDITLAHAWLQSLRYADLPGVFFTTDEVLPETVAFANNVAGRIGVLEFVSKYSVETATAKNFVVLMVSTWLVWVLLLVYNGRLFWMVYLQRTSHRRFAWGQVDTFRDRWWLDPINFHSRSIWKSALLSTTRDRGSLTLIPIIFQSVVSSYESYKLIPRILDNVKVYTSIIGIPPKILTVLTWPTYPGLEENSLLTDQFFINVSLVLTQLHLYPPHPSDHYRQGTQ